MFIILLLFVGLFIFGVLLVSVTPKLGGMSKEEHKLAEEAYHIMNKGLETKTVGQAERALAEYEGAYVVAQMNTRLVDDDIYQDDMKELRQHLDDLRQEEWEKKATHNLDKFFELYKIITDPSCKDVTKAYKSKDRCIKYWQDYFYSIPSDGHWYDAKAYMKQYLGEDYDDCMYSHETLDKKLSGCIAAMGVHYKRITDVKRKIRQYVAKNNGIQRSELFKVDFGCASAAEMKFCYKELIERHSIEEVKISNRFFVYIVQKEK